MFEHFGLKVIFGNERCTFIVKKTKDCHFDKAFIYENKAQYGRVKEHLIKTTKSYKSFTNKTYLKRNVSNLIKGRIF